MDVEYLQGKAHEIDIVNDGKGVNAREVLFDVAKGLHHGNASGGCAKRTALYAAILGSHHGVGTIV
jgi:hypothetical protein